MYDVPASHIGNACAVYLKTTPAIAPEVDVLRFYVGEHILSVLQKQRSLSEPLTDQELDLVNRVFRMNNDVFMRLFYYVTVICIRESRHCHKVDEVMAAAPEHLKKAIRFVTQAPDSKDAVTYFMQHCPTGMKIGDVAAAMKFAFYKYGHWSASYGGKAWGSITDPLVELVEGRISPTLFCDVAWALEHNGGCMFNKGMYFSSYTKYLKQFLDLQRAGQIPRGVLDDKFTSAYRTPDLLKLVKKAHQVLGHEDFSGPVDWALVAKFGVSGKSVYLSKLTDAQKRKEDAAAKKLASLIAETVTSVEYWPGKKIELTSREGLVKLKAAGFV